MPSRHLRPRDYAANPAAFGLTEHSEWVLPAAGTEQELRLARAQHTLAWAVSTLGQRSAAADVAYEGGFSVATWSNYVRGLTWMSRPAFAAGAAQVARAYGCT